MKAAFLLVPLLLAATLPVAPAMAQASGAWLQAGGPGRSGTASFYPQLDVLAHGNATLPDLPQLAAGGAFETPAGLIALARSPYGQSTVTTCQLVRLAAAPATNATPASVGAAFPCGQGATLVGQWDGKVLLCLQGDPTTPMLQARDPMDGSVAWTLPTGVGASARGSASDPNLAWDCGRPALDAERGLLVVPYSSPQGANRIVAYRLADHAALWNLTLTAAANLAHDLPVGVGRPLQPDPCAPAVPQVGQVPGPTACQEALGDVRLGSATLTSSGVLITARTALSADLPAVTTSYTAGLPFLAWTDLKGVLVGTYGAQDLGSNAGNLPMSVTPATLGSRAAVAVGGIVLVIDPSQRDVALAVGLGAPGTNLAAPVWSRDGLAVPLGSSVWVCPSDLVGCNEWNAQGSLVDAAIGARDGTLWVAEHHQAAGGTFMADLVRVRLDDAASLTRIPLPFTRADAAGSLFYDADLVPLASGDVLATTRDGDAVWMGVQDPSLLAQVTADHDQPLLRQVVHLDVQAPAGAPPVQQVLLGWGEGSLESFTPTEVPQRSFSKPGSLETRVTLAYADGRTATTLLPLMVLQQSPPEQGLLAKLFGPDLQNYTFFAIGLIVTAATSGIAAASVAKGRKRIDRRLRELDVIQERGRRDPFPAVRDLHDYRLARRRDLSGGHLDDTQYTVLEAHADKVLQVLRQRILGNFVGRVSDPFSHALDTALADGALDGAEAKQLLDRVADEPQLDAGEKTMLRNLIASWQLGAAEAAGPEPVFVLPRARKDA